MWPLSLELAAIVYVIVVSIGSIWLFRFGNRQSKSLTRRKKNREVVSRVFDRRMANLQRRAIAAERACREGTCPPKFTCDTCLLRYTCQFAYRDGNLNGECVASKNSHEPIQV